MVYELNVKTYFSAAHSLRGYQGACEQLHGHNWEVEVVVMASKLNSHGMVMDFADLKAVVNKVVKRFDHCYLNNLAEFEDSNPTTENIAALLYGRIARRLPRVVKLKEVRVWETPNCFAVYRKGKT